MTRKSLAIFITAFAVFAAPAMSLAQGGGGGGGAGGAGAGSAAGGASTGTGSATGTTGIGGAPSGSAINPGNTNSTTGLANPPRGTDSARTAQSSSGPGTTTGSAAGRERTSEDHAIDAEDAPLDRKIKGICRGC
ncbi:hypothetical protein [Bradyrhizobium cenepequi]|uniref:hypothetical protein n=1 Tax=Bradyrhizobium cenepequi TaxID=2821403 RepID=UPI001CE2BE6F|nr:hypothetical protein [Bradyrhizobium cenepequi]MCA6113020.1 hypothetical protein [Bradyrhizobium cenepequi]